MEYDPDKPHEYILAAYQNILSIKPSLVHEIGRLIPIPSFDQNILEDLCRFSLKIVPKVPMIVEFDGPVIVVGDLHGDIFDLVRLLSINRLPPYTKYLFLGDYVDRGQFSLEVVTIILSLECKYPENVYLLRGNHEASIMNSLYGFKRELQISQYTNELWQLFNDVFDFMPFVAIISKKIFCVHGGLSPDLTSLNDIKMLQRPLVPQSSQLLVDLIWSDPSLEAVDYSQSLRGSGKHFGIPQIEHFFKEFGYQAIFRGHQCITEGVSKFGDTELYTIFSCSNYCANETNKCGFMKVDKYGEFAAYSLPPYLRLARVKASRINCSTQGVPELLLQKIDEKYLPKSESEFEGLVIPRLMTFKNGEIVENDVNDNERISTPKASSGNKIITYTCPFSSLNMKRRKLIFRQNPIQGKQISISHLPRLSVGE